MNAKNKTQSVTHKFLLGNGETQVQFSANAETMAKAVEVASRKFLLGDPRFLFVLCDGEYQLVETWKRCPGLVLIPNISGGCSIAFAQIDNDYFEIACACAYAAATAMIESSMTTWAAEAEESRKAAIRAKAQSIVEEKINEVFSRKKDQ